MVDFGHREPDHAGLLDCCHRSGLTADGGIFNPRDAS